jgi:ABC-type transport system involved in multi-copper enzyme maturation permease subunit
MSLISATQLVLRRRRGMMVAAAVLAIGMPLVVVATVAILHAQDPASRPAGGSDTYTHLMSSLDLALAAMAAIVGATAGAGDLSAGTFRDLVATGRSRTALFLARLPAALGVTVPLGLGGFAIFTAACYGFAGGTPTPTAGEAVYMGAHTLAVCGAITVVAVGLAELVGSRGIAIGVLLFWVLAAEQLLVQASVLGTARDLLVGPALDRVRPLLVDDSRYLPMTLAAAGIALATWCLGATLAGLWRCRSRAA